MSLSAALSLPLVLLLALDRAAGALLRLPIWLYQKTLSRALPPSCRYHPSCSAYASEALAVHGALLGLWLGTRRLLRCHPWAPGGPDPVPPSTRRTQPGHSGCAHAIPPLSAARSSRCLGSSPARPEGHVR